MTVTENKDTTEFSLRFQFKPFTNENQFLFGPKADCPLQFDLL